MDSSILALNIIEGPLILTCYVLSALSGIALFLGRSPRLAVASGLADSAPVHTMAPGELANLQPLDPCIPANLSENVHSRPHPWPSNAEKLLDEINVEAGPD